MHHQVRIWSSASIRFSATTQTAAAPGAAAAIHPLVLGTGAFPRSLLSARFTLVVYGNGSANAKAWMQHNVEKNLRVWGYGKSLRVGTEIGK